MVVPLVMVVQLGHALYPFLQILQDLPLVLLVVHLSDHPLVLLEVAVPLVLRVVLLEMVRLLGLP